MPNNFDKMLIEGGFGSGESRKHLENVAKKFTAFDLAMGDYQNAISSAGKIFPEDDLKKFRKLMLLREDVSKGFSSARGTHKQVMKLIQGK